jgi:hypothetical protein
MPLTQVALTNGDFTSGTLNTNFVPPTAAPGWTASRPGGSAGVTQRGSNGSLAHEGNPSYLWMTGGEVTYTQTTAETIAANTKYGFSLAWYGAYVTGATGSQKITFELLANGVVVASRSDWGSRAANNWCRDMLIWEHTTTHTGQTLGVRLTFAAIAGGSGLVVQNCRVYKQALSQYGGSFLATIIEDMAENSMKLVTETSTGATMSIDPSRTPFGTTPGQYLVSAFCYPWPGGAYDPSRERIWIFGGGHTVTSINGPIGYDIENARWDRYALPTQIEAVQIEDPPGTPVTAYRPVGGRVNAPMSNHPIDSVIYLPNFDRFLHIAGPENGSSGGYTPLAPGEVLVGPFLYDASKIDGNKVGGATGTGVVVADEGMSAWQHRQNWTSLWASGLSGITFGVSAVVRDNAGADDIIWPIVFTDGDVEVRRIGIPALGDPLQDTVATLGTRTAVGAVEYMARLLLDNDTLLLVGTNKLVRIENLDGTPTIASCTLSGSIPGYLGGCEYDPVRNRIVSLSSTGDYPNDSRARLSQVAVPSPLSGTWTSTAITGVTGDTCDTFTPTAPYGTFIYVRSHDVFLWPSKTGMAVYKPVNHSPLYDTEPPPAEPRRVPPALLMLLAS